MENARSARDRHLFGPGRKRILTLDGGGVRGALSLAFLERVEALLAEVHGRPIRLSEWFDLIAGTSTGSIIAAALALGWTVAEVRDLFHTLAPEVFKRSSWRIPGWTAKFDARMLEQGLVMAFGDRSLDSEDLKTGLCVVLKRIDTGGSWILLNNPRSHFWTTPDDGSFIGNASLRLAKVIRASTAAPLYFDPELIDIIEHQPPGLFLDGGMTPHNNPALVAFFAAHLPPFGLNWPLGPDKLTIVSVGTGTFRPKLSIADAKRTRAVGVAASALGAMIAENQRLSLMLLSWLGRAQVPWQIDSEVGDLGGVTPVFGKQFVFCRLNVLLEPDWLAQHLDLHYDVATIGKIRALDRPASLAVLHEIGRRAALRQLSGDEVAQW